MALKGTELLGYQGRADRENVQNVGVIDLKGANEVWNQVALFNFQKNKSLYDQRVQDRDKVYELINDDELIPDQILDAHRGLVDGELQKIEDLIYETDGDIMQDPKRYRELVGRIQGAKNTIKQAQKWYVGVKADVDALGKEGNPDKRGYRQGHMDAQLKKDFWKMYNPYAPVTDYTQAEVQPDDALVYGDTKVEFGSAQNGWITTKRATIDPERTIENFRARFVGEKDNYKFRLFIDDFFNRPDAQTGIDLVNKKLREFGVEEIKYTPGPNGRLVAAEDQGRVAAKIKLASAQWEKTEQEYNKEASDVAQKEKDRDVDWFNAHTARMKAKTEAAQLDWDKNKWKQSTQGPEEMKNAAMIFADKMWNDLKGLADGDGFIKPDKLRQLTAEQLKYLGKMGVVTGKDGKTIEGIQELKLEGSTDGKQPTDAIYLDPESKEIKILRNAKDKTWRDKAGKTQRGWIGHWDPQRTTTITNIATNRLTEQVKAGAGKEINAFVPIDKNQTVQSTTQWGGGQQSAGSQSNGTRQSQGRSGAIPQGLMPVNVGGRTYYTDGNKIVDSNGNPVQ
jgi:hypothetical protein